MTVKEASSPAIEGVVITTRDRALDILRGIAIVEVMTHHTLSVAARKFAEDGSWQWWAYVMLNRILHFAVPTFLFASAFVLTKSLLRHNPISWKRFFKRRARRTLAPYLLWSVLFIFFSTYKVKSMPLEGVILWTGGTLALPVAFTDGGMFVRCFLYGKSYFHLYFMSVLLQMSLIFPFIYLLLRRIKRSFGFWLFTSLSIHTLVVSLNYQYRFLPYPASTVLWYAPPIILGAWLGMRYTRWEPIWREYKNVILLLFGVGILSYLIVEISVASNSTESLPSLLLRAYPFSLLLFATSTAIILLKLSHLINQHPAFGPLLARFGDRSLALFLMHPIILHFLSGPRITKAIDALPASGLWLLLLVIAMTWISVEALYRLRLNVWLFGREDQYGPLAPKPKHAVAP